VPIIDALLDRNIEVLLATSGVAHDYLQARFPNLELLTPPAYDIRFSSSQAFFDIMLQTPRILKTVQAEHTWLSETCKEHGIHGVISDNRYGMFASVPSVIITHQTNPQGPSLLRRKLRKMVHQHLNNFNSCWIPDSSAQELSGELSDTDELGIPHSFIGSLSRLNSFPIGEQNGLVAIVSGPETQRTEFEQQLLQFLKSSGRYATLICGKPGENKISSDGLVSIHDHMDDDLLSKTLLKAEFIFCRSGYSTILDLAKLGLRANLIPTKGQSEQKYLAKLLTKTQDWQSFDKVGEIDLAKCVPSQIANPARLDQQDLLVSTIDLFLKEVGTH
jgi:hypothetical protein